MFKSRKQFIAILVVTVLFSARLAISAETLLLEKDSGLKSVSAQGEDKYLLAVAKIKQLVGMGYAKEARAAIKQFKKDFPKIAGPDFDAFMKAEMLFCAGKFSKAVKEYDKFLEKYSESKFYEAALDREFAVATAYLNGQKIRVLGLFKIRGYESGEKIIEKIIDRAGGAPIAQKAALAVVESLEKRDRFNEAYQKWSEISSRWPTGQIGKDALLGMARCKHAVYRGPRYNAASLVSAKSYYENYKSRYPEDANAFDIDRRIEQINEQLAYKEFCVGHYYQRTGSNPQADLYYQMVMADWPKSTAAKMANEKISQKVEVEK